MTTGSSRMDVLSEVSELERIPLPYKTLYHALVLKNDMPIDLMRERHQSGSEQLLTWIRAALKIVETVAKTSTTQQEKDEDEDVELESEIQDVVSGFGQYEPKIESTIEILVYLEESIIQRTASELDQEHLPTSPSPEIETIRRQWETLQTIIGDLDSSNREHQRLRDGIQSVRNLAEQARQAAGILEKCLTDIASDRQRTSDQALAEVASRNGSSCSLNGQDSDCDDSRLRSRSSGVDSNDILELDSRYDLLALQIDTFQKMYPECTRSNKVKSKGGRTIKQQECGSIADKKQVIHRMFKELLRDWASLRTRREQLWRDLQECERWRTRIEKMTAQIEEMLEPVEHFHKMCINILATLNGQAPPLTDSSDASESMAGIITSLDISESPVSLLPANTTSSKPEPMEIERLWVILQDLDEKQTKATPAIENMFWIQEGELQHHSKSAAIVDSSTSASSEYSPLYPTLGMLERQKKLRHRWSNLKGSLDTVGNKLHTHHTLMKERANSSHIKREATANDKARVDSGTGMDVGDCAINSPALHQPGTNDVASRSHTLPKKAAPKAVKKYMLVKGNRPEWAKPRPWCPSANPASPGMPGFPMQTSQWGYYLLTKSENEDGASTIITPAPLPPTRVPTPPPVKPLRDTRPPFSPAGNRRYAFGKPASSPTRTMPERSISVAGGDLRNNIRSMTPMTASGDIVGWERTLRQSASFSMESKQPAPAPFRFSNNSIMAGRANVNTPGLPPSTRMKRAQSAAADGSRPSGLKPMTPGSRRNSHNDGGSQRQHKNNSSNNRRSSVSSSDEEGTVMDQTNKGRRGEKTGAHTSNRNESTTSVDSMTSSGLSDVDEDTYGSSRAASSFGAHSPSPFTPMFGSSFVAARSSAALHSALLASMSSSSGSLRRSSSSLSGSEQDSNQHSDKDKKRHQQQVMRLGTTSASTWMSMNMNLHTGSILSALSFSVPKYSFDEDFSSIGSMDETIAAM